MGLLKPRLGYLPESDDREGAGASAGSFRLD